MSASMYLFDTDQDTGCTNLDCILYILFGYPTIECYDENGDDD